MPDLTEDEIAWLSKYVPLWEPKRPLYFGLTENVEMATTLLKKGYLRGSEVFMASYACFDPTDITQVFIALSK